MKSTPITPGQEYRVGNFIVPAKNAADAICKWLKAMINRDTAIAQAKRAAA